MISNIFINDEPVGNVLQVKVKEIDGTQKIEIIGEFKIHISDANLTELLKNGVHIGNPSA
jgi:hypothetical protein